MSHLLIDEDDAAIAEALDLDLALTALGHTVRTAGAAEVRLAAVDGDQSVALAVVDVVLPGMDGFERFVEHVSMPLVIGHQNCAQHVRISAHGQRKDSTCSLVLTTRTASRGP